MISLHPCMHHTSCIELHCYSYYVDFMCLQGGWLALYTVSIQASSIAMNLAKTILSSLSYFFIPSRSLILSNYIAYCLDLVMDYDFPSFSTYYSPSNNPYLQMTPKLLMVDYYPFIIWTWPQKVTTLIFISQRFYYNTLCIKSMNFLLFNLLMLQSLLTKILQYPFCYLSSHPHYTN